MKTILKNFVVKPTLWTCTLIGGVEIAFVLYDRVIAPPLGLEGLRTKLMRLTKELETTKR